MSLQFLATKSFHPASKANQKRVWVAEQRAKEREQQELERSREIRKRADALRAQQEAAASGDASAARAVQSHQVSFLYAAPPGLPEGGGRKSERGDEDDAVKEFRRKAESHAEQRKLERYVGRRREEPLTIQDQVERFPMLKDAPVEGSYTQSLRVNFNPVGVRLRNVKCIRCGQWGHQSGDRECSMRDQNPNDATRQVWEDPVTEINKLKSAKQELVFRRGALPLEMQETGEGEEFEILQSDDDDVRQAEDAFLASLSSKQRKLARKRMPERDDSGNSSSESDGSSQRHRSKKRRTSKHKHKHKHRHRARSVSKEAAHPKQPRRTSRRSRSRSESHPRSPEHRNKHRRASGESSSVRSMHSKTRR